MILQRPFVISSRLMPALAIGNATISLEAGDRDSSGRTVYRCWIDLPDGSEHEITDLRSGCQGGTYIEGFASLLSFLVAAAESYAYRQRTGRAGENEDLFPAAIVEWADCHADDLSMLQSELTGNF